MTKQDKRAPEPGWESATWEGAEREAIRRWPQLPLENIVAAQEEMLELSLALAAATEREE